MQANFFRTFGFLSQQRFHLLWVEVGGSQIFRNRGFNGAFFPLHFDKRTIATDSHFCIQIFQHHRASFGGVNLAFSLFYLGFQPVFAAIKFF